MRILFLTYHGFEEASGISKKMLAQIKGLRQNGHEVHVCYYDIASDGHRCRYIDDTVIKDYGKGSWAAIRQRMSFDCIYDYCIREHIEFVYARCFMNANPWLIRFFKRLKKAGIHAVTEIPTYPYDEEFKTLTFVDFDSTPLHQPLPVSHDSLSFIAVAEVHPWHAFERVIAGIGEYYKHGGTRNLVFHIVGGVHPNHMKNFFLPVIQKYGIQDRIVFHGQLFGDALTEVFNQCQFAIGSLGRHRSGITVIKTLKNREYATRGIPFIYSEQDSDFDHQPYVLKAPADESPIDIQQIIDFVDHFQMKPEEIRKTVEHLSWKIQMEEVVKQVDKLSSSLER